MKFLRESKSINNLYHAYHGTRNEFNEFKYEFLGQHGSEHGWGFYFTNRESIAQSYGDYIIEADLKINNPLSSEDLTINENQVKEFISKYIDSVGDDFLSSYGDINSESYNKVLNKCINNLFTIYDNDVDLISDIFNTEASYDKKQAFENIENVFGKDGIIYSGYDQFYGKPITNYIVFRDDQILNRKKKRVE